MTPASAVAMTPAPAPASVGVSGPEALVEEPTATTPAAPPRDWRSELLLAWVAIAAVLLLGLLARRVRLMQRIGHRQQVTDPGLRDLLETLCLAAGYPHYVRLTAAPGLASPVALPGREICLPQAIVTDLGREQQRGVLAHELAHLVRRDPRGSASRRSWSGSSSCSPSTGSLAASCKSRPNTSATTGRLTRWVRGCCSPAVSSPWLNGSPEPPVRCRSRPWLPGVRTSCVASSAWCVATVSAPMAGDTSACHSVRS